MSKYPEIGYPQWAWEVDCRAVVAGMGSGTGVGLWTVGPWTWWATEPGSPEGAHDLTGIGLAGAPRGISVWEGRGTLIGNDSVTLEGSFREPTDEEWEAIEAGDCPWHDAEWRDPKEPEGGAEDSTDYLPACNYVTLDTDAGGLGRWVRVILPSEGGVAVGVEGLAENGERIPRDNLVVALGDAIRHKRERVEVGRLNTAEWEEDLKLLCTVARRLGITPDAAVERWKEWDEREEEE